MCVSVYLYVLIIIYYCSHFLEFLPFTLPLDVRYDEQHQTTYGDVRSRKVESRVVRARYVKQPPYTNEKNQTVIKYYTYYIGAFIISILMCDISIPIYVIGYSYQ